MVYDLQRASWPDDFCGIWYRLEYLHGSSGENVIPSNQAISLILAGKLGGKITYCRQDLAECDKKDKKEQNVDIISCHTQVCSPRFLVPGYTCGSAPLSHFRGSQMHPRLCNGICSVPGSGLKVFARL